MYFCRFRRAYNILHRNIIASVGEVFINISLKQPCILKHHRIRPSQIVTLYIVYTCAVYRNISRINIIKAHEQIYYGSFSGSCSAGYGNKLSLLGVKIKILYYLFAWGISKAYILYHNISAHVFKLNRIRLVCLLRFGVYKREYPFSSGKRALQFSEYVCYLIYRAAKPSGVEHK